MSIFRRNHPVQDRIRFDVGGGGGGGGGAGDGTAAEPTDAIHALRKRLGEAFLRLEPDWHAQLDAALAAVRQRHPRRPDESEAMHERRLSRHVLVQDKPDFVRRLESRVRLYALLLGHPQNALVREDIVPRLDYWHHRSGTAVDFVCLGFSERSEETPDGRGFAQIVRMLQQRFDWRYSGETDLLVFNGRYEASSGQAVFDLSNVVALTLERALEAGAITSVSSLMEALFRSAESHAGDNPAWAFSDAQGLRIAGSGLKHFVLSLLPEWARKDAERGLHFHVRDLRPRPR